MRNDLTACDGPITATAAPIGRGGSRRRRMVRGLLALPLALALIAPGATALADATTGYSQTTPAPKTEATPAPKTETSPATNTGTTSEPKQGAGPTQTSSTPSHETVPTKASGEPTATTAKAKTLPFTGLDLRWITLGGLLLVGMGLSIMVVQRRRQSAGR